MRSILLRLKSLSDGFIEIGRRRIPRVKELGDPVKDDSVVVNILGLLRILGVKNINGYLEHVLPKIEEYLKDIDDTDCGNSAYKLMYQKYSFDRRVYPPYTYGLFYFP